MQKKGISSINRGKYRHVAASIFWKRGLGVEVTPLSFAQPPCSGDLQVSIFT